MLRIHNGVIQLRGVRKRKTVGRTRSAFQRWWCSGRWLDARLVFSPLNILSACCSAMLWGCRLKSSLGEVDESWANTDFLPFQFHSPRRSSKIIRNMSKIDSETWFFHFSASCLANKKLRLNGKREDFIEFSLNQADVPQYRRIKSRWARQVLDRLRLSMYANEVEQIIPRLLWEIESQRFAGSFNLDATRGSGLCHCEKWNCVKTFPSHFALIACITKQKRAKPEAHRESGFYRHDYE